jgi:hypothetical protein
MVAFARMVPRFSDCLGHPAGASARKLRLLDYEVVGELILDRNWRHFKLRTDNIHSGYFDGWNWKKNRRLDLEFAAPPKTHSMLNSRSDAHLSGLLKVNPSDVIC